MSLPLLRDFALMLTNWKSQLDPVLSAPIAQGRQLTAIALSTSAATIPHGLGRTQLGWFLTDIDTNTTVKRTGSFNSTNMVLTAGASCTVSIWVY